MSGRHLMSGREVDGTLGGADLSWCVAPWEDLLGGKRWMAAWEERNVGGTLGGASRWVAPWEE